MNRSVTFTASLLSAWIIGYLLYTGRSILIPIVIAIFIWHLLNTINAFIKKTPAIGSTLPNWISQIIALLVVALLTTLLVNIISNNVNEVIAASTRYQERLTTIFNQIDGYFNIKILTNFDSLIKSMSVQAMLVNVYGVFTAITGSTVLIFLYIAFLFVEQHYFRQKLFALFPQRAHRELVENISHHLIKDMQTYLGLKTLLSLITATASWAIMKYAHLDFAEFWALLIFFLNFIPNVGPIIATAFPALLALIQFSTWYPFLVVSIGISAIQFVVGNLVEPRFLSRSLNLSPLIILFALALWGAIWGVLGMFLAVPITVMMMIVFAHFEKTRPIAILLSQNGSIQHAYEKV